MSTIIQAMSRARILTFDCYGTLIDWKAGMFQFMERTLPEASAGQREELFKAYLQAEAEIEAGPYLRYREVMRRAFELALQRMRIPAPDGAASGFAEFLPSWPPFVDTRSALQRLQAYFKLGVLSNIDRDLFARTAVVLNVPFDFVITAEDVGAYKPSTRHFESLSSSHAAFDEIVHIGQSPFHDGLPTRQLGIAYVWINRYNDRNEQDVHPIGEFPTLTAFADAAINAKRG
jgi:2-haloalkanoic acid dehalogenase type II